MAEHIHMPEAVCVHDGFNVCGSMPPDHLLAFSTHTCLLLLRNYTADATVFVVTYPVDSSAANLPAAKAWEAQFVELAKGQLTQLAHAANLSLSFSSER